MPFLPVTQVPPAAATPWHTQITTTPSHPVTRAFLSWSYSTLFHFTVNFFNYSARRWIQDIDTILDILPFSKLSFGCALEWQHHIHPSRGLSILSASKVKEPLLMSSSYILSKGKYFSLNFRMAKRNRLWMHWVVPLIMATFSVTMKLSQVLKLWFCVCVLLRVPFYGKISAGLCCLRDLR